MRRGGVGPLPAVAAAALLVLALASGPACGALLAIDLGSEFLKLSIVKPGRIPISIVINEMSKRKTPALVAFVDGERLVGEEAAGVAARYPDRVYAGVAGLLGRPADDPALTASLKASYRPYTLVPAPNRTSPAAAAVQTDGGDAYSAEELAVSWGAEGEGGTVAWPQPPRAIMRRQARARRPLPRRTRPLFSWLARRASPPRAARPQASLLEYARQLAEVAADGSPITDCVLTVPASFTQQQVGRAASQQPASQPTSSQQPASSQQPQALTTGPRGGWQPCRGGRVCPLLPPRPSPWRAAAARRARTPHPPSPRRPRRRSALPMPPAAPGPAGCRQAGGAECDGPDPQPRR